MGLDRAEVPLAAEAAARLVVGAAEFVAFHAGGNWATDFGHAFAGFSVHAAADRINYSCCHAAFAYVFGSVDFTFVLLHI